MVTQPRRTRFGGPGWVRVGAGRRRRTRLDLSLVAGGLVVAGATMVMARSRQVQSAENAVFRSVNGLPDGLTGRCGW